MTSPVYVRFWTHRCDAAIRRFGPQPDIPRGEVMLGHGRLRPDLANQCTVRAGDYHRTGLRAGAGAGRMEDSEFL